MAKLPKYIREAKTTELKARAKTLGIMDYNAIKRKSQAVNQALGTHYSPKTILYWEIKAREQGRTTAAYTAIEGVRGIRADVTYTPTYDDAMYFNRQQFDLLAKKVPQVDVLLQAKEGDYIDHHGDVWREEPIGDGTRSVWRNLTTGRFQNDRPDGIQPATPQRVRAAIYKIRDIVDGNENPNPYEGYIDIYLSDAD